MIYGRKSQQCSWLEDEREAGESCNESMKWAMMPKNLICGNGKTSCLIGINADQDSETSCSDRNYEDDKSIPKQWTSFSLYAANKHNPMFISL